MTELKTLKDFEFCDSWKDKAVWSKDLKQEAIKWIKEIYVFKETETDKWFNDFMGIKTIYSEEAKAGIINFIKHFFNITEEDLK